MYNLYICVLGVNILPLDWPCKIPEVYKARRFWRRVYYLEKNGVPAVTLKSAIVPFALDFIYICIHTYTCTCINIYLDNLYWLLGVMFSNCISSFQQFAKNIFGILQSIRAREEGTQKHHPAPHTPSVVSVRTVGVYSQHPLGGKCVYRQGVLSTPLLW